MISTELCSWANIFHHLEPYITSKGGLQKAHVKDFVGGGSCKEMCAHSAEGVQCYGESKGISSIYGLQVALTLLYTSEGKFLASSFRSAHLLLFCTCCSNHQRTSNQRQEKAYNCPYVLAESNMLHMDWLKQASRNTGCLLLAGISKNHTIKLN